MNTTTIVCCVEAGWLEESCLRMIESLRLFGGRLAKAPVWAVTPRPGPPLSRRTRRELERLQARHVRFTPRERFAWNGFMNKPHALMAAEAVAETPQAVWLDSDLLVVDEPHGLLLDQEADLAAACPDKNVGTAGEHDPNDAYWQKACQALGLDCDDLPWVVTDQEAARIRLYYNSGVFAFRRGRGFGTAYLEDCRRLLRARVASRAAGIFFTDQVALGLTAHRLGLRQVRLGVDHNLPVGSATPGGLAPEAVARARILHLHDAMWPHMWPGLVQALRRTRPRVGEWLEAKGPLYDPRGRAIRAWNRGLRSWRGFRRRFHQARAVVA